MNATESLLRKHLSDGSHADPQRLSAIGSFREHIEKPTLNIRIHAALTFKRQGHFDKAMLAIAETNRDQITAIRQIQHLLTRVADTPYPEVVFEKFRQIEPFEIGITDADPVLSLLARLGNAENPHIKACRLKLHECELHQQDEAEYLQFVHRRQGAGEPEKIAEARATIATLAREMTELRNGILGPILAVVDDILEPMPSGPDKDQTILDLARHLFVVLTSPVPTKPAADVATDP